MTEEPEPRTIDRNLIAVAGLTVLATITVVSAIGLVLAHAAGGEPDIAVVNGAMVLGFATAVVATQLGLDYARRRWVGRRCDAVTATNAEMIAELRSMAQHAHTETIGTLITIGGEVGLIRENLAEDIGALAREVEQVSAKVNAADWNAWAARLTARGEDAGAVVDIHRPRGNPA